MGSNMENSEEIIRSKKGSKGCFSQNLARKGFPCTCFKYNTFLKNKSFMDI